MSTPVFDELLEALSDPAAYPGKVESVEVLQTHISAVFLAGSRVYKIKKPLDLGFLDFTTLDKRQSACEDEVRLNRRLAPETYLGVLPITKTADGVRVGGEGEAIEFAVCMERLPENRTYERLLEQDALAEQDIVRLARRVADFHIDGACTPEIAAEAHWDVVARNNRENFTQIEDVVGKTISAQVYQRLQQLTEEQLEELKQQIENRADAGLPRDTHGDLHLDHVYSLPRSGGGDEIVIIDCIEFNTRFRYADPVSDMAFLYMDLMFHDRPDLAHIMADTYFDRIGDHDGKRLLNLYAAYRAVVRGKVEGFVLGEEEVPEHDRERSWRKARAHFLLALGILAPPQERPMLVLVAGLPGSGKSKLCENLVHEAGMVRLDSDQTRKDLAGIPSGKSAAADWNSGIYTPEWNDRTYATLLDQAESLIFEGKRVAVEASFREERRRLPFIERARSLAVPCLFLECRASETTIRERLGRRKSDISDAGIEVYQAAKKGWENPGHEVSAIRHIISTELGPEDNVQSALDIFHRQGLA